MAATATQDEDLLIITDDASEADTSDIDFSFDFWDDTEETSVLEEAEVGEVGEPETDTLDILTQDVSPEVSTPEEDVQQVEEATVSEENLDFGFDLTEDATEETAEIIEETSETPTEEASLDLGLTEEDVSVATTEVSEDSNTEMTMWGGSTGDDSSMNDILSATIAKLAARKTTIASQKDTKLTHEDEIQSKIQELQNEHATIEQELARLDSESDKITKNIEELENMKLDPVKEHNAKRVAKKK